MMARFFRLIVVMAFAASPAFAQAAGTDARARADAARARNNARAAAEQTKPSNPGVPAGKPVEQKAAETQARAAAQPPRPEPSVNIRVELTITDQRGTAAALSKTITMTMMDTAYSRIRTGGDVRTPLGFRPVTLNVDATPRLHKDGKIRLDLTIEYRPTAAESDTEQSTTPTINEQIGVLLEDGKPLVISQSADPATDRKVKIEAKATILR
jgi:hypothetical protein